MPITTPQIPDDSRKVCRGIDSEDTLIFSQVGFQEIDFDKVFGGKTSSTTENTIGFGLKSWTLDIDDGKILPGHTVQLTALADPSDCFMYGVVLAKDTTSEPAVITVSIHTCSDLSGTFSNWEIQIVEVTRETTLEVGDEDVVLEDHHRVVFYTEELTAPRTLTLSSGETLVAGTRVCITDVSPGGFSSTGTLTILGSTGAQAMNINNSYSEFMWSGASWSPIYEKGWFFSDEANTSPVILSESADSAAKGPNIVLRKVSASPAADDGLGQVNFQGYNSAANSLVYANIGAYIKDPTSTSEDGGFEIRTFQGGVASDNINFESGAYLNGATGGDMGVGTLNATALYQNGAAVASAASIADHIADTSDAHDASAISYAGGTGISATDVEAAIDELATEKLDASSYTAADVLSKLLTVDGAASGLDADLLDGNNIGTSGATVPLLNGTNTWSGAQTVVSTVTLENTDGGAAFGPLLRIDRGSASPAANDAIGLIQFSGRDSAANLLAYCSIQSNILDPTDGSEDGRLDIQARIAASNTTIAKFGPGVAIGTATDQGANTLNAGTLYEAGTSLAAKYQPLDADLTTLAGTYIESTFTPTVTLVGGAGNTVPVYTVNTGRYTRIGNRVFVDIWLTGDGGAEGAGTGTFTVAIPVAASTSHPSGFFPVGAGQNGGSEYIFYGSILASASVMTIHYFDAITNRTDFTGALQNNTTRSVRLKFQYDV